MKYYTKTYLDWIDGRYVVVAEHSRLYFGPTELSKGASSQENDIAASNAELNKTIIGAYNTAFANQSAVFNAVKAVYDPILKAGPSQYGFSSAEDAALRTSATEANTTAFRNAEQRQAETLGGAGGGNTFLPSGVNAQVQAQLAGGAAARESESQLGITEAGYATGRQNFLNATNTEMGVAAGYNPLGYASAASTSGKDAFGMAKEIADQNAAASPWGAIGGMLGGVAGSFLGPVGASIGSKIGGALGGAGSRVAGGSDMSFGADTSPYGAPGGGDMSFGADTSSYGTPPFIPWTG